MKRRQYIPNHHSYQPKRELTTPPPSGKKVEKRPLGEVMKEAGADMRRMNAMINMCVHLADVMEYMIMDAESELKKVDSAYDLELRHPVERIKAHCRYLVSMVDKRCSPEYSERFGEIGDDLVNTILEFFKLKSNDNDNSSDRK